MLRIASFLAITVCFSARNDAACALLRPSASDSAKLANRTVNHSHTEMARMNPELASPDQTGIAKITDSSSHCPHKRQT
jgi:hypothetical protein